LQTFLNNFFFKSGTSALSEGKPTGMSNIAFSLLGLFNSFSKKPIGAGVWVKVARPALCSAVNKKPDAIPTDSLT